MNKKPTKIGQKWAFSAVRIKANSISEFNNSTSKKGRIMKLVSICAQIILQSDKASPMLIDGISDEL